MKVTCPLCQSSIDSNNSLRTHKASADGVTYRLYGCTQCDLHFWDPMCLKKEVYEEALQKDYFAYHQARATAPGRYTEPFFKLHIESGKTLLDVGCGDGIFLEKNRERGLDVWGIDLDSKSVAAAVEKRKLINVHSVTLEEFINRFGKSQKFDYVTFFEVLEHQDNIRRFIGDVSTLLKPGGCIAGSVPNRGRFLAELSNQRFGGGDNPPHHFTRWNSDTLRHLLTQEGFEDVQISTCYYFSLLETSYWWQRVIFGNIINDLRYAIKRRFVQKPELAHVPLRELIAENQSSSWSLGLLNIIAKFLEHYALFPIAILTQRLVNREGQHLFFFARKSHREDTYNFTAYNP